MKLLYGILIAVLLTGAVFGIFWSAGNDFGHRQAVEFYPYSDEITLDNGMVIRSSGVIVVVNHYESASTDQEMANLMIAARNLYPDECSGENYEVAVRRPGPEGIEEKYSYSFSVYNNWAYTEGVSVEKMPVSTIEYGRWDNDEYTVRESYESDWTEIARIASGQSHFRIVVE